LFNNLETYITNSSFFLVIFCANKTLIDNNDASMRDVPPNYLRNPNVNPKMKQQKKKGIKAHFLACSTLGVGGCVGASKWD
jgi:hypothetical protein